MKYHNILTKDFLIKEYVINRNSMKKIAKMIGCNAQSIFNYLKNNNIATRTQSEAMKGVTKQSNYSKILTKKFLYKEYIINKKSIYTIAKETNINHGTVWNYLVKYNIPIRNKKFNQILTKKFLIKEYVKFRKSSTQIAKEIGCSAVTIWNYLIKYKIKIRTTAESRTKYTDILTKSFLIKEYIQNKKSCNQIAKEVGCGRSTIRRNLITCNIPRRNRTERQQGKNHPIYIDGRTNKIYYCKDCLKKGIKTEISKTGGIYNGGRCMSCSQIERLKNPKNHPCYIENLDRDYPNKFNKILKESIRERDNHVCQICGKSAKDNGRKLDVHHIDYDKNNLDPINLIALCRSCHIKSNYNREVYIEYFKILKSILIK